MATEVGPLNVLGSVGSPPAGFVDPLDNSFGARTGPFNPLSINNSNWTAFILGLDTPFGSPIAIGQAFSFGQTLSGGGGIGMTCGAAQFGANPAYQLPVGIIPTRLLPGLGPFTSPFFGAKQKFIQLTYNVIGAGSSAGWGLINFDDNSGTGISSANVITHDCYLFQGNGNSGLIVRYNSGAAANVFQSGIALTQGDVWRLSMDATNPAQTIVTVTKNGTQFAQFTDNSAARLLGNALPVIAIVSVPVAFQFESKNFSCNVGL